MIFILYSKNEHDQIWFSFKKSCWFLEECIWEWYEGECSKSCGGGIRKERIGLRSGDVTKCYENLRKRKLREERSKFCNTKKCNTANFATKGIWLIFPETLFYNT